MFLEYALCLFSTHFISQNKLILINGDYATQDKIFLTKTLKVVGIVTVCLKKPNLPKLPIEFIASKYLQEQMTEREDTLAVKVHMNWMKDGKKSHIALIGCANTGMEGDRKGIYIRGSFIIFSSFQHPWSETDDISSKSIQKFTKSKGPTF